jgi:hypothetical protein
MASSSLRNDAWTAEGDMLLARWMAEWEQRCTLHDRAAHTRQVFHRLIAIPTIAMPVVSMSLSALMNHLDVGDYSAACQFAGSVISSVLAGVLTIVRADAASERHHAASIRYADLVRDAQQIQATETSSRMQQGIALQILSDRASALRDWEPILPKEPRGGGAPVSLWLSDRRYHERLLSNDGLAFGRSVTS